MSIYYLDSSQLRVIQRVMKRLYTEQRLTGDEMRDLANTLDAVTHSILRYGEAGDPGAQAKDVCASMTQFLTMTGEPGDGTDLSRDGVRQRVRQWLTALDATQA